MNVIETRKLTRCYGKTEAVSGLDLVIPEGSLYALLGPNGAGKTTTLKTLMNILRPTSGESRVLGVDSKNLSPLEFSKIGYVSENQELPEWMTISGLMNYCKPFYPTWDDDFGAKLVQQFDLDPGQKIKNLSRGTRMKVALLTSIAYRPRLLVLDEPFSGLDPLVRDEFIRGILELTDQEQWTVVISSHDVDEVEKLADWVGILNNGRLHLSEPVETLQSRFRQATLRLPESTSLPSTLPPTWLMPESEGSIFKFVESDYEEKSFQKKTRQVLPQAESLTAAPMSLREIFVTLSRAFRMPVSGGKS